jgi:hypothetical protein
MGGEHSKEKESTYSISKYEKERLLELFKMLSIEKALDKNSFAKLYTKSHFALGQKLYQWIILNASILPKTIAEKDKIPGSFVCSIEALLRSYTQQIHIKEYSGMNILSILLIIFHSDLKLIIPPVSVMNKSEAIAFLKFALDILLAPESSSDFDEVDILSIIEGEGPLEINTIFDKWLPNYKRMVSSALEQMFMSCTIASSVTYQTPTLKINKSSELFTLKSLTLLKAMVPQFANTEKLFQLFSSSNDGLSFNRVANALMYYNGPSILAFSHIEKDKSKCLFILINDGEYNDTAKFDSGSLNNKLIVMKSGKMYSILPDSTCKSPNYAYLNTRNIFGSDLKSGLGIIYN